MALEDEVFEFVVDEFGRGVVIAFYLVADDISLVSELVLRITAVEHNVEQQVDGPCEVFLQNGSIEYGVFLVGKGVEIATYILQTIEYLQRRATLGALEGGVLAEVCQTLFATGFLTRAGIDAQAQIDDG